MRFRALACDYDGTLATHGLVDPDTVAALRRLIASGRDLLMVTGRELPELKALLPQLDLFRLVVAENGGLLYFPATGEERVLAQPPAANLIAELQARGVGPISVGRSIVATWEPHEQTVLATIRDLGLDLQVIFNKGAVMILPSGVNKATGLSAALREMQLSRQNVVAIGDAENDHAFLNYCRIGVAVANALPALKERAEIVTAGDHGRGVVELIDSMIDNDLADVDARLLRHQWRAEQPDGSGEILWQPGRQHLLVRAAADQYDAAIPCLLRFLDTTGFQACLVRCGPPLEVSGMRHSTLLNVGSAAALPKIDEILDHLQSPKQNVQIALCAGGPREQSNFLKALLDRLETWISVYARPHVLILPGIADLLIRGVQTTQLAAPLTSVVIGAAESQSPADIFPSETHFVACDANHWIAGT